MKSLQVLTREDCILILINYMLYRDDRYIQMDETVKDALLYIKGCLMSDKPTDYIAPAWISHFLDNYIDKTKVV